MKLKIIFGLIATILISSCATQQTSCPTYENDYVYTPRKAAKTPKKSKSKPRARAEQ